MTPRFTIVTIVFNDQEHIAATVESVQNQRDADFEYLVIDGASTDGTLEYLQQQTGLRLVSEPDDGIYDAMNKAVRLAKGQWVLFMNSGDRFAAPDVLQQVSERMDNADLVYGDHLIDYGDFQKLRTAGPLDQLWRGMQFSHQSLFARTELLRQRPFSREETIIADYDFIYRSYVSGRSFQRLPLAVSIISVGGVSDLQRIQCIKARQAIVQKTGGRWYQAWYYQYLLLLGRMKMAAKRWLPGSLVHWYVRRVR